MPDDVERKNSDVPTIAPTIVIVGAGGETSSTLTHTHARVYTREGLRLREEDREGARERNGKRETEIEQPREEDRGHCVRYRATCTVSLYRDKDSPCAGTRRVNKGGSDSQHTR